MLLFGLLTSAHNTLRSTQDFPLREWKFRFKNLVDVFLASNNIKDCAPGSPALQSTPAAFEAKNPETFAGAPSLAQECLSVLTENINSLIPLAARPPP